MTTYHLCFCRHLSVRPKSPHLLPKLLEQLFNWSCYFCLCRHSSILNTAAKIIPLKFQIDFVISLLKSLQWPFITFRLKAINYNGLQILLTFLSVSLSVSFQPHWPSQYFWKNIGMPLFQISARVPLSAFYCLKTSAPFTQFFQEFDKSLLFLATL